MKKVMKFVKGKKEDDYTRSLSISNESKKLSFDKSDDSFKEDDFINRDKSVTKLHKAVWNENSDKLKTIIKTHDIDITDRFDRTALYLAVIKNNASIINLLLENNANQNIPDIDGITPFLKSIQLGHKDCATILLNQGADLKKTDKDLNSCLHYAVLGKFNEILSFLLEYEIDCNVANIDGDLPIHIAIRLQNTQMIDQLLKNKSDLNAVNSAGLSGLALAQQLNNPQIMALIEKYSSPVVLSIPGASDDVSLKSSYENLKPERYTANTDTNINININEKDEITEENSEAEVSIKHSENTSPQSGIIPPPCKPLRSLEYLQTGMNMEPRPIHLLTLGTVRTRHISMTESDQSKNNTPHRYSYQGDFQSPVTSETCKIPEDKNRLLSKVECDSTIQSDWGSNESLPLDEFSFRKSNSNSGSIRSKTDTFLQKQFSILEDYERKLNSTNNPETQQKLDEIENLLEDNNRINAQLEKFAGDVLVRSAKSKSLPRHCEQYSSYHKGSYSLPRTLESGKDPFREMRNYGYFKPRSHFFSLKMLKGEKRNTFLDKLKSMFNKKSQIHLQEHDANANGNGTWLYKEKYKVRHDHEFYSSKLDTFSVSDSSSSRKSHHSDVLNEMRCGLEELHEDQFGTMSNYDQNKVNEKRRSLNMSRDGHLRKPSTSTSCCNNGDDDQANKIKFISLVKQNGTNANTHFVQELLCEDCLEIVRLKLASNEENLTGKEKLIQLLKTQLGLLTERNVKSINEAQNIGCKYSLAKQELDTVKQICVKYEEELQKLRLEKTHKQQERDELALRFKEDADRWKKQYEDLVVKIQKNTQEEDWRNLIQNEVTSAVNMLKENSQSLISSLEKQNKKLEGEVEKLQQELDANKETEQQLRKDVKIMKNHLDEVYYQAEKDMKTADDKVHYLRQSNDKLVVELENLKIKFKELQNTNEINLQNAIDANEEKIYLGQKYTDLQTNNNLLQSGIIDLITHMNDLKEHSVMKLKTIQSHIETENINFSDILKSLDTQITDITEENAIQLCHDLIIGFRKINNLNHDIISHLKDNQNIQDKLDENVEILKEKDLAIKEALTEILTLNEKVNEANDIIDELTNDLKNKEDVANMQASKICDLKEILEDEIQKCNELSIINKTLNEELENQNIHIVSLQQLRDNLEQELINLKCGLNNEKSLNKKVSNENLELRDTLETLNREKQAIEQQNIDLKSSFLDLESAKTELEEKCCSITLSNQSLRKVIEANKDKIQHLEKFNQQLQDQLSEQNQTDDRKLADYQRKIDLLFEENKQLKSFIEEERDNQTMLKKQIHSLELFHANEIQTKVTKIEDLQHQIVGLKDSEVKLLSVEEENKKLYDIIEDLNKDILSLNNKLENINKLSDPEKYNEAIKKINEENHELNRKISSLQKQLEDRTSQKSTEKMVEIDVDSQKVIEKDIYTTASIDESFISCETNNFSSYKESSGDSGSIAFDLENRLLCLRRAIQNDLVSSSSSEDIKSTSLPNLDCIKQNRAQFIDTPTTLILNRKSSSVECLANNEIKLNLSQTTLDSQKSKCENRMEKQLDAVNKLRRHLNDIKVNLNMPQNVNECTATECTNRFKLLLEGLQQQVNYLNLKSAEESEKCHELQAELKGLRGQMVDKETMADEIKKLRRELYKQKVESVQEIEKCRIRKEAEILELQFQLKQQYQEKRLKLLADLAEVQNALERKTVDDCIVREQCENLIKQVAVNQETRSQKSLQLFAELPMNNVDPDLETGLREIFQVRPSFEMPETSRLKHRADDALQESSSNGNNN